MEWKYPNRGAGKPLCEGDRSVGTFKFPVNKLSAVMRHKKYLGTYYNKLDANLVQLTNSNDANF